jgi:hypothetical protein
MEQFIHTATQYVPWNKGQTRRTEGASEAEGHLGNSRSPSDRKPNT